MTSFSQFFKHRMVRFFAVLFAGLLLASNIGLYIFANIQYNREIERQQDAFLSIMSHFIQMEDIDTSITYVEHYEHTQGVHIIYYDPQGNILYQSQILPKSHTLLDIVGTQGQILGRVTLDNQTSELGKDLTWGVFWFNVFSLIVFIFGFVILYRYLNEQYRKLDQDLNLIGQEDHFMFSDIKKINDRVIDSIKYESDLKKLQSHYVQTLAHDVKTPLTIMKSYLEGIQNHRLSFDEQINQDLLDEIQSIETLIPKLIATDKEELANEQDIGSLIHEQVQKLVPVFATKQIQVVEKIDKLVMNITNKDIIRLIQHLLFNAYYYSKPNKRIHVILSEKENKLVVNDEGIGMDSATIERIQQGPYRNPSAQKFHQKGSGVGMQIVFDILRKIHATYAIDSKIGEGTTVTIYFKHNEVKS